MKRSGASAIIWEHAQKSHTHTSSNLSKALYYSQTEPHWFFDPQKTYENPRPISTSMKIIDYVVFFTSVFVFSSLGTEQQQSYSAI